MPCGKGVQQAGSTQHDLTWGEKKWHSYTAEMLGKFASRLLLNMHHICRLEKLYFGM